jgi:hypothetical protein
MSLDAVLDNDALDNFLQQQGTKLPAVSTFSPISTSVSRRTPRLIPTTVVLKGRRSGLGVDPGAQPPELLDGFAARIHDFTRS